MSLILPSAQCVICRHFGGVVTHVADGILVPSLWCSAFPVARGGIPDAVTSDAHDHRAAYPGDAGVRWSPAIVGASFPALRPDPPES
jgi:hypothetical protein